MGIARYTTQSFRGATGVSIGVVTTINLDRSFIPIYPHLARVAQAVCEVGQDCTLEQDRSQQRLLRGECWGQVTLG